MSVNTLSNVLDQIRQDLATLPNLRQCHFDIPDSINLRPAIVVAPATGTWRYSSHSGPGGKPMRWALHTVNIVLLVARKDLARDYALVLDFADTIPDWLWLGFERDEFGGSMVMIGDPDFANNATRPMRYTIGESRWGSDADLVLTLELDISINAEIQV